MFLRAVLVKQLCREQVEVKDMEVVLVYNSENGSDGKGQLRWKKGDRFCAMGK